MFWFTVESENYTLKVKPLTEENGTPDLCVELERHTDDQDNVPKTLQAIIDADLLVEWIITQLIWSQFVGDRPGVRIVKFVDDP